MLPVLSLLWWLAVTAGSDPAYSSYSSSPCVRGGLCLPPVLCSPHYLSSLQDLPASSCLLAPGTPGLCCPGKKAECKISFCPLTSHLSPLTFLRYQEETPPEESIIPVRLQVSARL